MKFTNIEIQQRGDCSTVFLNRPEVRNALSIDMIEEIGKAYKALNTDKKTRFIILRGRGNIFCAGADLNWMKNTSEKTYALVFDESMKLAQCFYTIYNSPKVTFCAVHGGSYGGANGFVTACDFACAPKDTLFAFSEVRLGLVPGTIVPYVLRKIGLNRTKELMLTGKKLDGKNAKEAGLIDNIVENPGGLDRYLTDMTSQLRNGVPEAMKNVKTWINACFLKNIDESLVKESAEVLARSRISPEADEGIRAFFEKRSPNWQSAKDE